MKRIVATAIAAGAIAAVVIVLVFGRDPGAGPFAWPKDASTYWHSFQLNTGEVAGVGIHLGPIDRPAVLLDVHPADSHAVQGLSMRYAASTSPNAPDGAGGLWKPKAWGLHPVAGFSIPAHTRAEILAGGTAEKPGHYFIHAFVVDYKIGHTRYSALQQDGLEICAGVRGC